MAGKEDSIAHGIQMKESRESSEMQTANVTLPVASASSRLSEGFVFATIDLAAMQAQSLF
jgi:hypothetical protein